MQLKTEHISARKKWTGQIKEWTHQWQKWTGQIKEWTHQWQKVMNRSNQRMNTSVTERNERVKSKTEHEGLACAWTQGVSVNRGNNATYRRVRVFSRKQNCSHTIKDYTDLYSKTGKTSLSPKLYRVLCCCVRAGSESLFLALEQAYLYPPFDCCCCCFYGCCCCCCCCCSCCCCLL